MSWLRTFRQFTILLFIVITVLALLYSILNLLGKAQEHHQIDHPVLNKINNYIYLDGNTKEFSFQNTQNKNLPDEIKSMTYFNITKSNPLLNLSEQECLFLNFSETIENPESLKSQLEIFVNKSCVFVNSDDPRLRPYLSRSKPRWFYNISVTDIQRSRFLTSIGLESLAPLKGDFVIIDLNQNPPISKKLIAEIERRKIVIFLSSSKL